MRLAIYAAALWGCLVMVAGCISYEQHITFESDGSGRMTRDVWVDALALLAEPSLCEMGEGMRSAFTGLEGVTVEESWSEVEGEGRDAREHTRVVVTFDKLERLTDNGRFESENFSFKKKGKEFAFTQVFRPDIEEEPEDLPEGRYEELARALLEDYTVTFTVVMPGRVTDTNGTVSEDGRTVTWAWSFYDLGFRVGNEIMMTATSRK